MQRLQITLPSSLSLNWGLVEMLLLLRAATHPWEILNKPFLGLATLPWDILTRVLPSHS